MSMTIRQLVNALNYMPQDMIVEMNSMVITPDSTLMIVNDAVGEGARDQLADTLPDPDEILEEVLDDITHIIQTHDIDVADEVLNWVLDTIYAGNVGMLIAELGGIQNVREAALVAVDMLEGDDLLQLDAHLDEFFYGEAA